MANRMTIMTIEGVVPQSISGVVVNQQIIVCIGLTMKLFCGFHRKVMQRIPFGRNMIGICIKNLPCSIFLGCNVTGC